MFFLRWQVNRVTKPYLVTRLSEKLFAKSARYPDRTVRLFHEGTFESGGCHEQPFLWNVFAILFAQLRILAWVDETSHK